MTSNGADATPPLGTVPGKWVLGVDGGGTKTEALVAHVGPDGALVVTGRARSGSSNLRAVGIDTALRHLEEAVDAASADGGVDGGFDAAVIAAAGAASKTVTDTLLEWNKRRGVAQKCQVVHDGRAVLAAAFGAEPGVALIVGTGSVAMAIDRSGATRVAGGWGYWFGDEGSGYAIGRAGLAVASRAEDGRSSATALVAEALRHFGAANLREVPTVLGESRDARREIAAFAPCVSRLAEQGDHAATGIIETAAGQLAELYRTVSDDREGSLKQKLAVAGGVGCGSTSLRNALSGLIAPTEMVLVQHPVEGCLQLAAESLAEN